MNGRTVLRVAAATLVVAGTVTAVLIGVSESGEGAIGRHVLITTPADGAEVPLGSSVPIAAQGFDPRGVIRWTVTVAGDRIAADELEDDAPTHVPIEAEWVPDETGTFDIVVRVVGVGERERPPDRRTVRVVAVGDTTTTTSRSTSTTRRTATTDTTTAGETTTTTDGSTTTDSGTTDTTSRTTTTGSTGSTGTTARTGTTRTTSPTSTSPRPTATTRPTTTAPPTTAPPTTASPTTAPDTTPPRVAANHSPSTTIFSGDQITFTATATDDRALAVVEVWVQAPGANFPSIVASCPSSPCSHTTTARAGDYSYFGIARDAAGNQARSAPRTVFVNSPPF